MIDSFLSEIGQKLADRWLSALIVPGLLLVAAGWAAITLGQAHALDFLHLIRVTRVTLDKQPSSTVSLIVAGAALALLAVAAAAVARLLGLAVQRIWILQRNGKPATVIGRTLRQLDQRVQAEYHGLRTALVWPRLWLLLPDSQRSTVEEVAGSINQAALQSGWSVLYLIIGIIWWPALLIGTIQLTVAWASARSATRTYATLIESIIDTSQPVLAGALGIELPHGVITKQEADQINARLGKTTAKGR
jgi:hypothetical protein